MSGRESRFIGKIGFDKKKFFFFKLRNLQTEKATLRSESFLEHFFKDFFLHPLKCNWINSIFNILMVSSVAPFNSSLISSVESTAKCRVKSNATIQNNSILEDGRDTSIIFEFFHDHICFFCIILRKYSS